MSDIAPPEGETRIEVSRGFTTWLRQQGCGIAFTSYQTGKLFLVGVPPDGRVSLNQQSHVRAMGLHAGPDRLYLASQFQVWRLENTLASHERANGHFDALYVPRNAQTTGDLDVHELGVDSAGRVIFVNTRFSCLATFSTRHGFRPLWRPAFISQLVGEDRCHLNGLGMVAGEAAYVTAVSRSDVIGGWRERRHEGGVLIDVRADRIVTDQLSMPHSPRVHAGRVWLLDSGRGQLVTIDPGTGAKTDIAFCPGFLRGLSFVGQFALVTVSLPREGAFAGLALDDELSRRDGEAWCGVLVIDTRAGAIVEYLRLIGSVRELFDVAAIPGKTCPMSVGPQSSEMSSLVSVEVDA